MAALASPDVTLSTVEHVRKLLEKSPVPTSRNRLLEALADGGHTTTRPRLNRALDFFLDLGLAVEGSKGIQWTHSASPSLRRAQATVSTADAARRKQTLLRSRRRRRRERR
jgi:hypothetical protein